MKKILNLTIIFLLIMLMAAALADMDMPANLQVAMFFKIFEFDRSLTQSPGQDIIMGIFYDSHNPQSVQANDEIKDNFSQLSDKQIDGKNVVIKEITTVDQLHDISIVYVTPGVESFVSAIVEKCRINKILGISAQEAYARQGLAIALGVEDQKPKIIINKAGAQSCGADLSSKLLALAEII